MNRLILPILALSLNSCYNESWIGRKVEKATPEKVLGYLQKHHKNLFEERTDTIRDTIIVKSVSVDTAFKYLPGVNDTMYVMKDRVKVRIITRHDSIFVNAECSGDTVYVEKVVKSVVPGADYSMFLGKKTSHIIIGFLSLLILILIIAGIWLDRRMQDRKQ